MLCQSEASHGADGLVLVRSSLSGEIISMQHDHQCCCSWFPVESEWRRRNGMQLWWANVNDTKYMNEEG